MAGAPEHRSQRAASAAGARYPAAWGSERPRTRSLSGTSCRPGLDADDAWDDVQALLCWHPQSIDVDLLQNGREIERRFKLSWWDSLIVASAQSQNCTVLLSEDMQDGATYGGVTVRSPFTLSINEAAASYTARTPRSRHPPRGRPRKSVEPAITTESRE